MKISLKEINSVKQEISIDLDWSDIEKDFEKSLKEFSKKIKIAGFRPGKVPRKILMDRFQPSIEADFVENSVNVYYLKALEEKEITPVNMGSVSDIDFKFEKWKFGVGVLNGDETHPLKNTLLLTINMEI